MVVAIYYFLHQAGMRMRLFAFTIYTIGILAYLGLMLLESNTGVGAPKPLSVWDAAIGLLPNGTRLAHT